MTEKHTNAVNALQAIRSGMRVFVHGGAATPSVLLSGLIERAPELSDVEIIHIHTEGHPNYAEEKFANSFRVTNLFVGSNMRSFLDYDRIDYLPCFLSEIPQLFKSGAKPIDVALIHVSVPDEHGYVTLGVSVDVAVAAVESAKIVIAQVNPQMPRCHGDGLLHISKIDHLIEVDQKIPEHKFSSLSEIDHKIGAHVASFIEDGSTIQVGIGSIPSAVLNALKGHRHLGLHSELWTESAMDLIECGALDNSLKKIHKGKTVAGFAMGSRRFYDFIHNNPSVLHLGIDYVNSPINIMRNPKVCAINSAVEVDLTGQVCADSIGNKIISGVGGQMDFMRGAALSPGGKPIIALSSRTKKGHPRIVPQLKSGAGVVTTRAHVHYVVTEHGIANLYGKSLKERAQALINIAHPDDREALLRGAL